LPSGGGGESTQSKKGDLKNAAFRKFTEVDVAIKPTKNARRMRLRGGTASLVSLVQGQASLAWRRTLPLDTQEHEDSNGGLPTWSFLHSPRYSSPPPHGGSGHLAAPARLFVASTTVVGRGRVRRGRLTSAILAAIVIALAVVS
jgi:hypothetical protein